MLKLTEQQKKLVLKIDEYGERYPQTPEGQEAFFLNSVESMHDFKKLMDCSTPVEIQFICQSHTGFRRFFKLLEILHKGITHSAIDRPS